MHALLLVVCYRAPEQVSARHELQLAVDDLAGLHADWVETTEVAPTVLQLLSLNPGSLQAVQQEGTRVLPDLR